MRICVFAMVVLLAKNSTGDTLNSSAGQKNSPEQGIKKSHEGYGEPYLLKNLAFTGSTAKLDPSTTATLDQFIESMKTNKYLDFKISVYSGGVENNENALRLAHDRAFAIKDYFTSKGIASNRLYAQGVAGNEEKIVIRKKNIIDDSYHKAMLFDNVKFGASTDSLFSSSYPALKAFAQEMRKDPKLKFRIIGHTSSIGTDEYNMELSLKRAQAVKDYLVNECGINAERIFCIGMGDRFPATKNNDRGEGELKNDRIEVAFRKKE